ATSRRSPVPELRIGILVGSESDRERMQAAMDELDRREIGWEFEVRSAHRTPDAVAEYARSAAGRGLKVLICGAGLAAALPGVVPGGAGEVEAAAFVARWLERVGLDVRIVEGRDGRPSVIGATRGGGRTLLLNGHLDTVGLAGMERALEPRLEDGRLHGRGS